MKTNNPKSKFTKKNFPAIIHPHTPNIKLGHDLSEKYNTYVEYLEIKKREREIEQQRIDLEIREKELTLEIESPNTPCSPTNSNKSVDISEKVNKQPNDTQHITPISSSLVIDIPKSKSFESL